MLIRAVFFDLDGVLIDACDWHYYALNAALKKIANVEIKRDEHATTFNGLPTRKKLRILTEQGRIPGDCHDNVWGEKQRLTEEVIRTRAKIDINKQEMHDLLRARGLVLCCVTNSIKKTAKLMLEKTGQLGYMSAVITNEDVKDPKPNPEGYRKAMRLFELQPEEVLIVEDSDKGYESAIMSGAYVLRVRNASDVNIKSIVRKIEILEKEMEKQ